MRSLRITSAVLVIAFLAFLSIGLLKPKVTVSSTLLSTRNAATLFGVLTDADRLPEWMSGFVSIEDLLTRDGNVGSQSRLRMISGRDTLVISQETLSYEFGQEFLLSLDGSMFEGELRTLLTPVATGTELHVTSTFSGKSWYWRSLFPLLASSLKATQDSDYERLIELAESAPPSMVGEWSGLDSSGSEQLFQFLPTGEVRWKVAVAGETLEIEGIRWQFDAQANPMQLDLDAFGSGPLEGLALYAIVEFLSDGQMRFDAEVGVLGDDSVRPTEFTESAILVNRIQ